MSWQDRLSAAGRAALDLIYPPKCPGCGRMGVLFCQACQDGIEPLTILPCLRCGRPVSGRPVCTSCCVPPSSLAGIESTGVFSGPLRAAVHALKYEGVRDLARPLGARMTAHWPGVWQAGQPGAPDLILPVPLHGSRVRARGYNQSALLAGVLGPSVGLPVDGKVLVRSRATRPQVGLDAGARRENVAGAFDVRADVVDRHVVLVDDVCTTGATLEACAVALKSAGAAAVWGYTLSRVRWDLSADEARDAGG